MHTEDAQHLSRLRCSGVNILSPEEFTLNLEPVLEERDRCPGLGCMSQPEDMVH